MSIVFDIEELRSQSWPTSGCMTGDNLRFEAAGNFRG
jgi:hypothetical protein